MRNSISRSIALVLVVGLITALFSEPAFAKGRTGSRRSYPGHGKGSHYVGPKK